MVAHIKVGETYHQRKEVSEMTERRVFLEEVAAVQSQSVPELLTRHCDFSLALYLHRA